MKATFATRTRHIARFMMVAAMWLAVGAHARAGELANVAPLSPEFRTIDVNEHRGNALDLSLTFRDHEGNRVTLADLIDGTQPVLLSLNYFRCRVVCSVQLSGLAQALSALDWTPGHEFRVVTVSIDPNETPEDAAHKRTQLLGQLGKGNDIGWSLLTGDRINIQALAAALGISYAYDAEQDQFAHPAVAVFVTPQGTIAQYLYGLSFVPRDLRFALMEAGEGKLGGPVEKLYQSCFSYDASIGRYGPSAFAIMQAAAGLTVLLLGLLLLVLWRREKRLRRNMRPATPARPEENPL